MAKRSKQVPSGGRMFKEDDTILDVAAAIEELPQTTSAGVLFGMVEGLEKIDRILSILQRILLHMEGITGDVFKPDELEDR